MNLLGIALTAAVTSAAVSGLILLVRLMIAGDRKDVPETPGPKPRPSTPPAEPEARAVMPRPARGNDYIRRRVAFLYDQAEAPARALCLQAGWPC
jgi:hypothetical protein